MGANYPSYRRALPLLNHTEVLIHGILPIVRNVNIT